MTAPVVDALRVEKEWKRNEIERLGMVVLWFTSVQLCLTLSSNAFEVSILNMRGFSSNAPLAYSEPAWMGLQTGEFFFAHQIFSLHSSLARCRGQKA